VLYAHINLASCLCLKQKNVWSIFSPVCQVNSYRYDKSFIHTISFSAKCYLFFFLGHLIKHWYRTCSLACEYALAQEKSKNLTQPLIMRHQSFLVSNKLQFCCDTVVIFHWSFMWFFSTSDKAEYKFHLSHKTTALGLFRGKFNIIALQLSLYTFLFSFLYT